MADQKPGTGPGGVPPGRGLASDAAHRYRVAPVLDHQAAPGSGVDGVRHVAGGQDRGIAAAHRGVGGEPLVIYLQPAAGRDRRVRVTPPATRIRSAPVARMHQR
jgi:hypothetical protein